MAVADASFRISMDSMSLVFNELSGLRGVWFSAKPPCPDEADKVEELLIGKPSITYKGSLPALMKLPPRIRTEIPPPGSELLCCTCTPADTPYNSWSTEVAISKLRSLSFKEATEPVISFLF